LIIYTASQEIMFGLILAGQLVKTDARPVSETQVVFDVPDVSKVNHVVVFMTGQTPFPEGHGGAVYLGTLGEEQSQGLIWILLGHLSNEKPSAIFKISGLKKSVSAASPQNMFDLLQNQPTNIGGAQIGISVHPITELVQQTSTTAASAPTVDSFAQFTAKMLQNFFNYASSFAIPQNQMSISPNEHFVSLNVVQKWFENFQRRMTMNPNYWKDI
jgi:hypothetical protein